MAEIASCDAEGLIDVFTAGWVEAGGRIRGIMENVGGLRAAL